MDAQMIILALATSTAAIASPFMLRFDHGRLAHSRLAMRSRIILFVVMSLFFSTGFVAAAATLAGSVVGTEGVEEMFSLAVLWAPLLLLATGAAARRGHFGEQTR